MLFYMKNQSSAGKQATEKHDKFYFIVDKGTILNCSEPVELRHSHLENVLRWKQMGR